MGRNYDQVFQDAKHALGAPGKQVTKALHLNLESMGIPKGIDL